MRAGVRGLTGARQRRDVEPAERRSETLRRVLDGVLFLACATLALALVAVGTFYLHARATAQPEPGRAPPVSVDTVTVERTDGYDVAHRFAGRVEPARRVELAFEVGGKLRDVLVGEGADVAEGQVVAHLDTRALEAERDRLAAAKRAVDSDLERALLTRGREQRLDGQGFTERSALEDAEAGVARAEAAVSQAEAALVAADVAIEEASLEAPFAARVGARFVDEGAIVAAGAPVLSLFEAAAPVLRVGLTPAALGALETDRAYTVDVDGVDHSARYLGSRPNLAAGTRTVDARFEFALEGPVPDLFGQIAMLELAERVGGAVHRVPLTALVEGERGLWSVFVVERGAEANDVGPGRGELATLYREHVELVHAGDATALVRGSLPDTVELVSRGGHRVVPGQRVRPGAPRAPAR